MKDDAVCYRFEIFGLTSSLQVADAEELPFDDETFDLVYSWGVLHHTPNTKQGIAEVFRVLKMGGQAKIMIYHKYSIIERVLTHGDLLTSSAGQRHRGLALSIARRIWPRWLIRTAFRNQGLFMLVTVTK